MRLVDLAFAFPTILLAMVLAVIFEASFAISFLLSVWSSGQNTLGWPGAKH